MGRTDRRTAADADALRGIAGFTLVEMMIVVALVALVAGLGIQSSQPATVARVEAARAELVAALRFARDESLRTGKEYGVDVDAADNRIRVYRALTVGTPAPVFDVRDPLTGHVWDLDLDEFGPTRGVQIDLTSNWRGTCPGDSRYLFRDGGTPSCLDPLATLLEVAKFTLSKDGVSRGVVMEGFSGRVLLP